MVCPVALEAFDAPLAQIVHLEFLGEIRMHAGECREAAMLPLPAFNTMIFFGQVKASTTPPPSPNVGLQQFDEA